MKSLPEKDFWNEIKHRLANYTEAPEDEWEKIAGAVAQSRRPDRMGRLSEMLSVGALALLLFLPFPEMRKESMAVKTGEQRDLNMSMNSESVDEVQKEQWQRDGGDEARAMRGGVKIVPQRYTEEPQRGTEKIQGSSKSVVGWGEERGTLSVAEPMAGKEKMPDYPDSFVQVPTEQKYVDSQHGEDRYNGSAVQNTIAGKEDSNNSLNRTTGRANGGIAVLSDDKMASPDSLPSKDKQGQLPLVKKSKEETKREKKKTHFALYFLATPSLAYQKIVPEKNDAINIRELGSEGIFASNRMGFSAEVGLQLSVSKNLELYTSLSYYQQEQSVSYTYQSSEEVRIESASDGMSYIISPGTGTRTFDYAMRNAGASAGFLYRWKGEKLMHKVGGGLLYQRGFRQSGADESYDNSSSTYLNYQLLYRMEFVVNKKIHVFAQPTFTRALMAKETLTEPFEIKPYRAGLGIGILYRF